MIAKKGNQTAPNKNRRDATARPERGSTVSTKGARPKQQPARGAKSIDDDLIAEATTHIASITRHGLSTAVDEIGTYLLATFYNDDAGLYASTSPRKHASLSQLLKQAGTMQLSVSKTFLANSIAIAVVLRALPPDAAFAHLPLSHRVELLRIRDPERIEQLAQEAVEAGVSVIELRAAVRTLMGAGKTGRPQTPGVLAVVSRIARALAAADTSDLAFSAKDIEALSNEHFGELHEAVDRVSVLLSRLQALLEARGSVPTSEQLESSPGGAR